MSPEVVPVDPLAPERDAIARAADVIRRGGLVALPTETVYGLGACALDAQAVARIFAAKGRPATNPLIVHVSSTADAKPLASDWPQLADQLAARFWPGPLTLVLPKAQCVPDIVTAGGSTVALRVPAHAIARALIDVSQTPLAAPSANPSGRISATRAEHVLRLLGDRVDLVLDGGPTPGGLESTVVDVTTDPPRLLRPGLIPQDELEDAIGGPLSRSVASESEPLRSPGMLSRHYAPCVPLICDEAGGVALVAELKDAGYQVGWIRFEDRGAPFVSDVPLGLMSRDPVVYARNLFDTLHSLEEQGVDRIVVAMPPDEPQWATIRDRLRRAAAPP